MKNEELKEAIAKYIESKEIVLMGYSPEYIDDVKTDMEMAFHAGVEWLAGQFEKYLVEPEGAWRDRNGNCFTPTLEADDPIPLENIVGAFDIYIRKKQ